MRRIFSSSVICLTLGSLGLAMTALSQGCTFNTGSGLDGGSFGGNSSPPIPPITPAPSNACHQCMFSQCTGQWAVCQSNAECMAIYTCATQTSCDGDCVATCYDAHPNGQSAYLALATCDNSAACNSCSSSCSPTVAMCSAGVPEPDASPVPPIADSSTDLPDAGPSMPDAATTENACSACTDNACAAEKAACAPNTDCDTFTLCLANCGADTNCISQCGEAHAEGSAAIDKLANCTTQNCAAACGF